MRGSKRIKTNREVHTDPGWHPTQSTAESWVETGEQQTVSCGDAVSPWQARGLWQSENKVGELLLSF